MDVMPGWKDSKQFAKLWEESVARFTKVFTNFGRIHTSLTAAARFAQPGSGLCLPELLPKWWLKNPPKGRWSKK